MSAALVLEEALEITVWGSLTDTQGHRQEETWDTLLAHGWWRRPAVLADKLHGRGWSPATFAGDQRRKAGVERVVALVLDYEATAEETPAQIEEALGLWAGALGLLHTSYSHTPERPRFRLVLALSRAVTAAEYPVLWRWAASRCAGAGHPIDEACRDPSRLWFLPAVPPGGEAGYVLRHLDGGPLDVDAALVEQREREAPPASSERAQRAPGAGEVGSPERFAQRALEGALDDVRRAPKGKRHETIRAKAYQLGGLLHTGALTADQIERELLAATRAAGWDEEDKTRDTIRSGIRAGERAPREVPELRYQPRAEGSRSSAGADAGPAAGEPPPASQRGETSAPEADDWRDVLVRRRGDITADLANVVAFIEHDDFWRGRLRFNEARQQLEVLDGDRWRVWQDTDDTDGAVWFQRARGLRVRPEAVCQAVQAVARRHAVNPLTDELNGLVWDGVPRLDSWLVRYAGAKDSPYLRAAGACWLRSAIARAFVPGIKVDAALVLEGAQGAGKSSVFAVLGGDYFTDDIHDLGSKDAAVAMAGAWMVELPELSALGRTDLETLKAACSRQVDRYRPPYGRAMVAQPRRCVFGGTTNRSEYLRDETGNRRWLPVKVAGVDLEALRRDRDQLLAEAVVSWRDGGALALPREVWGEAAEEQSARVESDPWEDKVAEAIRGEREITVVRILVSSLGFELSKVGQREQNRVARCLARLGWERFQKRDPGGGRTYAYRPCHQSAGSGDK